MYDRTSDCNYYINDYVLDPVAPSQIKSYSTIAPSVEELLTCVGATETETRPNITVVALIIIKLTNSSNYTVIINNIVN